MTLSKQERTKALRVAQAVVAGYKPERDEVELIAQTVCDCAEAFRERLSPVYRAALLAWPGDGYEHWTERLQLQRIVAKCRAWELEHGELPTAEQGGAGCG